MKISLITTGGTIDKIYFDAKNEFEVGESVMHELLRVANLSLELEIRSILKKDSLNITESDRRMICDCIRSDPNPMVIVTHGTDSMAKTARLLGKVEGKVVIFTGSLQPARFRESDALFNIGCAFAAVQTLPHGVYIAMNGRIFDPAKARKNLTLNRFEEE
jgi:L-asparaginase